MYWFVGSLFAGAVGIQVTKSVTRWSDAVPVLCMKVILIIIAAVIFVFTSIAIMICSTISGLIRNYNLKNEDTIKLTEIKFGGV